MLTLVSGCAGSIRTTASSPQPANLTPELEAARRHFDLALQAGDSVAMTRRWTSDAELIVPGWEVVRGGSAIAARLTVGGSAFRKVAFTPARPRACTDGAFDHGEIVLTGDSTQGPPATMLGAYAARWRRQADGQLVLSQLRLADPGATLRATDCEEVGAFRFDRRRVSVALYPGALAMNRASTTNAISNGLTAQGYDDVVVPSCTVVECDGPAGPLREYDWQFTSLGMAVATVRFRDTWGLSLAGGTAASGDIVAHRGSPSTRQGPNSRVVLAHDGQFAAAMASFAPGRFDVGVGPAMQSTRVKVTWGETRVHCELQSCVSSLFTVQGQESRTEWKPGVVASVRFGVPVRNLHAELMVHGRYFASSRFEAMGPLQPMDVSSRGIFLGLGLGTFR